MSVQICRECMGEKLAENIKRTLTAEELAEIHAVIPIPETSNTSANEQQNACKSLTRMAL